MLCVVDCDPHGVDIMRMYKHGSRGLGHEAHARVPGLQWLGVKMDDILPGTNKPRLHEPSRPFRSSSSPELNDLFMIDPGESNGSAICEGRGLGLGR